MKKITYLIVSVLTLIIALNSCVKDTDYATPQINCEEISLDDGKEITIQAAIDQWFAENDDDENGEIDDPYNLEVVKWDSEYPDYIVGYVTSNDKTGNFYKELYIQDSPSDPTIAIKVGLNKKSLFTKYDIGRKVYIYLKDLALNKSHGEMFLGEMINNNLDEMNESTIISNIFRSCEAVEITPKSFDSPIDINESHIGMFIQLNNMQFDSNSLDLTFVDPHENYDTHLFLSNCDNSSTILLETSSFASFKNQTANGSANTSGSGSVKGVLTRDYGDDFYVLRLNNTDDFSFTEDRCDAPTLDCDNPDIGGDNVVFDDDFESYSTNEINIGNWTNINVNDGDNFFSVKNYNNNNYMQCSAYNSDENPLEAWLITPAINLDSSTDEELTFKTKTGYNNGAALSVFISTDFTGDVTTATWIDLGATIANGPSSGYEANFTDSGSIDISCLEGDIFVAFRYLGGDGGITTTFQIDDVKVTGN